MNKKIILKEKINILISEIQKAQSSVSVEKRKYLENLKIQLLKNIQMLDNNTLPESNGGVMGVTKCLSQFDDLANIYSLYNAAYDLDSYFKEQCKKW